MQNLLLQKASIQAGQYVEPSGGEASSLIDVRDIAAVAAGVADGGADDRALDLTGPEAFTGSEIAQALSAAIGKPVAFISPPIAAFRSALLDRGAPLWRVNALAELYQNTTPRADYAERRACDGSDAKDAARIRPGEFRPLNRRSPL